MKIRFKVNETEYEMTSDKYQIILNEIKTTKSGKNTGKETTTLVGYYKDEFQALKAVFNNEKYNSECNSFIELEKLTRSTLERLNAIADIYNFK